MKRRTVVAGVGAAGLGLAGAGAWRWYEAAHAPAFGPTAAPAAPSEPPLDAADARFLSLSVQLTGHDGLSPLTAQRIAAACRARDPQFDARVQRLAATPTAADTDAPWIEQAIISAWYLGQVGEAPTTEAAGDRGRPETTERLPTVVAYEHALMWQPVADVLPVPSYCLGAPGAWADAPPAS